MTNYNSLFTSVDVLVNGKPVKKYSHKGRIFIEAKEGTEYSIRVKNNSVPRKLANVSVDGINVVNGEAAGSSTIGYIIQGFQSYEIKGFRVSNDVVNAFKFSNKKQSYAAKSEETNGDTSNCGVIGVRFFLEKQQPQPIVYTKIIQQPTVPSPWDNPPWNNPWNNPWNGDFIVTYKNDEGPILTRGMSSSPHASARSAPQTLNALYCSTSCSDTVSLDLGTEFSNKEIADKVTEVPFEVGELESTYEIYYATRDALIQMGVPVEREVQVTFPTAFPSKFCKPPKK